jgi:hypothetical protein
MGFALSIVKVQSPLTFSVEQGFDWAITAIGKAATITARAAFFMASLLHGSFGAGVK